MLTNTTGFALHGFIFQFCLCLQCNTFGISLVFAAKNTPSFLVCIFFYMLNRGLIVYLQVLFSAKI